jgi:benzylsuccinate CoA-transferase BbsF subunit
VGANCLETALLDCRVNGREQGRVGNEWMVGDLPGAAPHGVYRCLGENRWCAIAIFGDREWVRFREVLGSPAWAQAPPFSTLLGRIRHREALQACVEAWTAQRSPEEVMQRLQAVGLAAGVVQHAGDLSRDPQLAFRGQRVVVDHPEVGPQGYEAPGFRLMASPAEIRPVPLLGQDNGYVFQGLLGLSDAEYAALEADGVFE